MADRGEIIGYLDELLTPGRFSDYGPNGLQVPGRTDVEMIVTGVSATLDLFERAHDAGADLILTHHGIFWNGSPEALSDQQAARLRLLLANDINLASYHLPLDAHPEVGNNALLCSALELELEAPFGEHKGTAIGWIGRSSNALSAADLRRRIVAATEREPLFFEHGPPNIERVAIVSGAASDFLGAAAAAGVDAFVTGEPAERVMAESREAGIHFAGAGHYATETFGVKRLGELLAERFGVRHEFVHVANPI